jgi:uncharacterized protein (TIGR04141 family)
MFALGLLADEEWIRRFGGEANVQGFAKTVNGADALQLNAEEFSLTQLPEKLRIALDLHRSDSYRASFPFLDYFRRETEKSKIAELDAIVADEMRNKDAEIGFALPDDFDLAPGSYRLSRYRREKFLSELSTGEVYETIDYLAGWRDPLSQIKVEAYDISGEPITGKDTLRSYTVATVRRRVAGTMQDYALTASAWFRVDQAYVDLVDRYIGDNVLDLTNELRFPVWDDTFLKANVDGQYPEDRYNKWLGADRGYVILDKDLYRGRAGERVEICDLLTRDKQLICVKRMDGSDKMSHLFQQGSVSAHMAVGNEEYQAKLMGRLHALDSYANFGSTSEWTIVYAIATSKPGELKQIMYFFSRAALKIHAESIKGRGFKVAIAKIPRVAGS